MLHPQSPSKSPWLTALASLGVVFALLTSSQLAHALCLNGGKLCFTEETEALQPKDPPQDPAVTPLGTASCPPATGSGYVDLTVYSSSLAVPGGDHATESVHVRLLKPSGVPPAGGWPVLYVLTGATSSFMSYSCNTFIQEYVNKAGVLVVMPDSSRRYDYRNYRPDALDAKQAITGFYVDWETPSKDKSPEHWETFIVSELPQIVQSAYDGNANQRAIAGASLGGAGAVILAARHPGVYRAVASHSGVLQPSDFEGWAVVSAILTALGEDTKAPLGAWPTDLNWNLHDPTSLLPAGLANSLLTLPIYVSAGTGDLSDVPHISESVANEMTRHFVSALVAANHGTTPSTLTQDLNGAGSHAWKSFDAALCKSLPMLLASLQVLYVPFAPCPNP